MNQNRQDPGAVGFRVQGNRRSPGSPISTVITLQVYRARKTDQRSTLAFSGVHPNWDGMPAALSVHGSSGLPHLATLYLRNIVQIVSESIFDLSSSHRGCTRRVQAKVEWMREVALRGRGSKQQSEHARASTDVQDAGLAGGGNDRLCRTIGLDGAAESYRGGPD